MKSDVVEEVYFIKPNFSIALVHTLLDCFQMTEKQLLSNTRIELAQLRLSNYPVTFDQVVTIINNIKSHSQTSNPGLLLGSKLNISLLNELGIVLISSQNIWASIEFVTQIINKVLFSVKIITQLDRDGANIQIQMVNTLCDHKAFIVEICFSYIANILHFLKLPFAQNVEYYFEHTIDPAVLKYTNIQTAQKSNINIIVFPKSFLTMESPLADTSTMNTAKKMCLYDDKNHQNDCLVINKIRQYLLQNTGQIPTLEMVAEKLYLTPWTISRRLKKSGTHFQQMVDEILLQKASHLLLQSTLRITEIAHQLGYSDVSSFRRAFKRWFGVSPKEYRNTPKGH